MALSDGGSPPFDPPDPLLLTVARACIATHKWGLASAEALAAKAHQVYSELVAEGAAGAQLTRPVAERCVRRAYAAELHAACRQREDEQLNAQGLNELYVYLLALARRRGVGAAEDLAQSARANIYLSIELCRQPQSFYYYARLKLLETKRELSQPPRVVDLPATVTWEDVSTVGERECLELLMAEIRQLPAELQTVILGQQLGMSDKEIARGIGKSVANVAVMRHRLRAHLKSRPSLRDCL